MIHPMNQARCTAAQLAAGEIDVDGLIDRRGIRFIGSAKRQQTGEWHALADVAGYLCRVALVVTVCETKPNGSAS